MSIINYQNFYKMLSSCIVIVPKQHIKYYLCGIHLRQNECGLVIESTDGHRAVQFKTSESIRGLGEFDIILDTVSVKILLHKIKALCYHKNDINDVEISSLDDDFINFNVEKLKLINARYPDINRVIWPLSERKATEEICFNPDYLADLKLVVRPFKTNKHNSVKLIFKSSFDGVRVTFEINDYINVNVVIMPCRY